jgi:DNA-binding winged helix-turn-helix (wHTH) protein/tetratricopeptide (TPR) repeat protein
MGNTAQSRHYFRFGEFELDPGLRQLRINGRVIILQEQSFQILSALLASPGQLVTRKELTDQLWPEGTFVDFEHSLNTAVNRLREVLEDSAEHPRFVETMPRRGYRFIAPVTNTVAAAVVPGIPSLPSDPQKAPEEKSAAVTRTPVPLLENRNRNRNIKVAAVVASALLIAILAAGAASYLRPAPKLSEKDSIVLADFTNTTGDPVFDETLRQGLAVQLEQSPFLDVVSDEQIAETLRLMAQPANAKLTRQLAGEVCQRDGSLAVLEGSIANLGGEYVIGLSAVDCHRGRTLAQTQVMAGSKRQVLHALGNAATEVRSKLGESLSSVQSFDTPLEQATTPSLEALQAYSMGRRVLAVNGDNAAAVPLFQRAIQLDPDFAVAYSSLGITYMNLGENLLAAEKAREAFELRERVSAREKFYIESHYYDIATGDLERARQIYEIWKRTYRRDFIPLTNLGDIYTQLGQYDRALAEDLESVRLDPTNGSTHADVVSDYVYLNRMGDAQAAAKRALSQEFDTPKLRGKLYVMAFLQNDLSEMKLQTSWGAEKPGVEDWFLNLQADSSAYIGKLRPARDLSRQAVVMAAGSGESEVAAGYESFSAVRESLMGNPVQAKEHVTAALRLSRGREVLAAAALALAFSGDVGESEARANELAQRFPEDTLVKYNYLPTIRARIALNRNQASKAIEAVEVAAPYELGAVGDRPFTLSLYPVYVRGQAHLVTRHGSAAAAEFQKIIDHPGVVQNELIGALAHLGLARANVLQGNTPKALAEYQEFLTLWKDADLEIPTLKQAKVEYAKLQ